MHPIERLRSVTRTDPDHATAGARAAVDALAGLDDDPAGLVTACRRLVDHEPALGVMWWVCAELLSASNLSDAAWRLAGALDADCTPETLATELPADGRVGVVGRSEEIVHGLSLRGDCTGFLVGVDALRRSRRRRLDVDLEEIDIDEIGDVLAPGDVLLVDVLALSPTGWVGPVEAGLAGGAARAAGVEVWGVAATGRMLPPALFGALCDRLDARRAGLALDARWTGRAGANAVSGLERHPLDRLDLVIGSGLVLGIDELAAVATCAVAPELLRFT